MAAHHLSIHQQEFDSSTRPSVAPECGPSQSLEAPAPSHQALVELSDGALIAQLSALVKQERALTVAVLLHLSEVERRGLHLAKGCSSMFGYCVERLGYSEDVAYKRVGAARFGRRFPLALDLMVQGSLHLSALMLIGPHLTDDNHRDWLMAATGKTKREVEKLVATRRPKPDVASSVRKLPERRVPTGATKDEDVGETMPARANDAPDAQANATHAAGSNDTLTNDAAVATHPVESNDTLTNDAAVATHPVESNDTLTNDATDAIQVIAADAVMSGGAGARASERPRVQPLSGSTFRVTFTAGEALKQKLERAQELCSHSVLPGDLPALIERALELLIEREENRRYAVQPPKSRSTQRGSTPRSLRPSLPPSQQDPDPVLDPAESVEPHPVLDPAVPAGPCQHAPDPVTSVEIEGHPRSHARQQTPDPVAPAEPRQQTPDSVTCVPDPVTCVPVPVASVETESELGSLAEFSRYVPAAVRRAVWKRDGGRCAFVDDEGNRCTERRFLEIDHIVAHARGGPTTIGNCRLLCRAHNMYRAKVTFGDGFLDRARLRARAK